MAAFLEKSTGSEGFHQVIDFLSQSHISYALTKKPEIYISLIKTIWRKVEASTALMGLELMNLVTKLSERIEVFEDDLKSIKQTYNAAFTKLILRIKKLECKVKTGKARKRARVVLSEDEEDDSSKQGRIDEDPNTYFHQDDEVVDDVVHDTAKERQPENSTTSIESSTALSTAGKEPRKYKGKAIMTEPEPENMSKEAIGTREDWV
ncbi:hypothetical protein Tco_1542005 [Tanacetum coccineum]